MKDFNFLNDRFLLITDKVSFSADGGFDSSACLVDLKEVQSILYLEKRSLFLLLSALFFAGAGVLFFFAGYLFPKINFDVIFLSSLILSIIFFAIYRFYINAFLVINSNIFYSGIRDKQDFDFIFKDIIKRKTSAGF